MEFRLIEKDEKERFNRFVASAPYGHFLQLYEWGDVKAETGWKPFRAVVEKNGVIHATAMALVRSLPIPGRTLMYIPRGPAVDWADHEAVRCLWQGLKELARSRSAILIKIDPEIPVERQDIARLFCSDGFTPYRTGGNFESIQPRFAMPLSIEKDEEELLQSFHHKTRYNIRLAMRKGVEVRTGTQEELPFFYALLQETATRDRFLIRDFAYYQSLWRSMIAAGHARLFVAYYQSEMIAATIAFHCGRKVWYIYGASGNRHRNVMPNYLLQWEMIRWAKSLGCQVYDFGGVAGDVDPEHPLYGLIRFKKGFGAQVVEYLGEYDLPIDPMLYWAWAKGLPILRQTRSSLIRGLRRISGRG